MYNRQLPSFDGYRKDAGENKLKWVNSRLLNSHGFTVCHTVSPPFSVSYGSFFISHDFTNFEWIFSKTHSFLKKQTQAAHSNTAEESISSMINENKTNSLELGTIAH